jgi:hypothetical protein
MKTMVQVMEYLQSKFSWTRFNFNNGQKQLAIAAAQGQFNKQLVTTCLSTKSG